MQDTFAIMRTWPKGLYARYVCSRDALGLARDDRVSCIQPKGRTYAAARPNTLHALPRKLKFLANINCNNLFFLRIFND